MFKPFTLVVHPAQYQTLKNHIENPPPPMTRGQKFKIWWKRLFAWKPKRYRKRVREKEYAAMMQRMAEETLKKISPGLINWEEFKIRNYSICHRCGRGILIPNNNVPMLFRCDACGISFNLKTRTPKEHPMAPPPKICKSCGLDNDYFAKKCDRCRAPLEGLIT